MTIFLERMNEKFIDKKKMRIEDIKRKQGKR